MSLSDYILKTNKDPQSWQFYKTQEACDWSAEEFNFTKEKEDYDNFQELLYGKKEQSDSGDSTPEDPELIYDKL